MKPAGNGGEAYWQDKLRTEAEAFPFAAGLYVRDLTQKTAFEYQADKIFPSASVIKLFILWSLFESAAEDKLDLLEEGLFDASDSVGGGILHKASPGARFRLDDLALLMLAVSDNTATNVLIDHLGLDAINASIRRLGFEKTVLGRKMLDFEAKKQGRDNYTTPRETGELLAKIAQKGGRMLNMLSVQKSTDKLPARLPFEDPDDLEGLLAHKTGELPGCEHDAGIFFHLTPRPVVAVVLTSGVPHRSTGCDFCAQVGKTVYDAFTEQP